MMTYGLYFLFFLLFLAHINKNVLYIENHDIIYLGQPERKREGTSSSLQPVPPSKKLKVALPNRPPGVSVPGLSNILPSDRSLGQIGSEPWENLAIDCDPSELAESILNNAQLGNTDKAVI